MQFEGRWDEYALAGKCHVHEASEWQLNEQRERRRRSLSAPSTCEEPVNDSTKREREKASVRELLSKRGERGSARTGKGFTEAKAAAKAAESVQESDRVPGYAH